MARTEREATFDKEIQICYVEYQKVCGLGTGWLAVLQDRVFLVFSTVERFPDPPHGCSMFSFSPGKTTKKGTLRIDRTNYTGHRKRGSFDTF